MRVLERRDSMARPGAAGGDGGSGAGAEGEGWGAGRAGGKGEGVGRGVARQGSRGELGEREREAWLVEAGLRLRGLTRLREILEQLMGSVAGREAGLKAPPGMRRLSHLCEELRSCLCGSGARA